MPKLSPLKPEQVIRTLSVLMDQWQAVVTRGWFGETQARSSQFRCTGAGMSASD